MMPIDPSAWAITPAWVQASKTSAPALPVAMSFFLSGPLYASFDRDGIRQRRDHRANPRIVRRAAVDVAVDDLQPSPQSGARERRGRLRRVNHQVHFGRRTRSVERHRVLEAGDLHAA